MMIIELLNTYISFLFNIPFLADADEGFRILNMELIDGWDFQKLLVRFAFNLIFILILVRGIYYPAQRRKDYLFSYVTLSMTIFLLCFVLEDVKIDMAFALGLFAIFGIIRYRTDAIPIKEMTYLFMAIGLSVVNALANKQVSYAELLFANTAVVAAAYGLEKIWLLRHETSKVVIFEKIELIKAENHDALKADLEQRTGIKINRFEIGKIDFLRDTANITIYFYEDDQPGHVEE